MNLKKTNVRLKEITKSESLFRKEGNAVKLIPHAKAVDDKSEKTVVTAHKRATRIALKLYQRMILKHLWEL